MDFQVICFMLFTFFVLGFSFDYFVFYNYSLDKYKEGISNEYRKWSSSARAGGSGMVRSPNGGVQNAVSAEECEVRASIFLNISDTDVKIKILKEMLVRAIIFTIMITLLLTLICYFNILPRELLFS